MGRSPECMEAAEAGVKLRPAQCALWGAICAMVIGVYLWNAKSNVFQLSAKGLEENYYNLLVQGFREGQLNLKREVPPGLAQLADPYDPVANDAYRSVEGLHDLSYYHGRLYLYFGVTPVLVLFWPYAAFTGQYLVYRDGVFIFFSVGFLAGAALLWALWRRYFAEVRFAVMVIGTLALGLANFTLPILSWCKAHEVAISCGYALTMVTLMLIWKAVHVTRGRCWWLVAASLAYGLAVGARPSLLLGAVILLIPVAQAWRAKQRVWPLALAATGPIVLIGLGLLAYNALRFGDPLEFGQRYQLSGYRQGTMQQFSLGYLWLNFRVGFLELARWNEGFPFVQNIEVPRMPRGYFEVVEPFGILTNIPLVWLAMFAPLAWRHRPAVARSTLRWFLTAVALFFVVCALTLCLHNSMCLRYELEFASPLVLLAVVGILGVERALAGQPVRLRLARWVWSSLLTFSVLFNLLLTLARHAEAPSTLGGDLLQRGLLDDAVAQFKETLEISPRHAGARNNLGNAYLAKGQVAEAIAQFCKAVELQPDFATGYINLGNALLGLGQVDEAIGALRKALQLKPDHAWGCYNLGTALLRQGQVDEAMAQLQRAVALDPELVAARINLGNLLFLRGRGPEAVGQLERALARRPDLAEGHNNLGYVLQRLGQEAKAIGHYEQALAIRPDYVEARNNLARVLATSAEGSLRNGARAVELAESANQLAGGKDPAMLDTLATAYAEVGRFSDAVRTAQAALELAKAAGKAEQARQTQERLQLYQAGRPYHERAPTTR